MSEALAWMSACGERSLPYLCVRDSRQPSSKSTSICHPRTLIQSFKNQLGSLVYGTLRNPKCTLPEFFWNSQVFVSGLDSTEAMDPQLRYISAEVSKSPGDVVCGGSHRQVGTEG